jgi:hypothetical protein
MQYRIEMDYENWPSYLDKVLDGQVPNYCPITKYIKMKATLPFNFKVGQYVLVLTNKERFAKGDIGNLAIYKIRQIVGPKIYLNEIRPDGVEVVDNKPYKPYELEPISEDKVYNGKTYISHTTTTSYYSYTNKESEKGTE